MEDNGIRTLGHGDALVDIFCARGGKIVCITVQSRRNRTGHKGTFVGFIPEIAGSSEIRYPHHGNAIDSLRYDTIAQERFGDVCDIIDDDITTGLLQFDDAPGKVDRADQACAECQFRPGGNIVNDLEHGPSLVGGNTIGIVEQHINRLGVCRIGRTGKVAPEDIVSSCITIEFRAVAVGQDPDLDALA